MPVPRSKKRDTTLYDLLDVSPDATNAQIAKVKNRFLHFYLIINFNFRLIKLLQ
jgi:hypothetical protein